MLQTTLSRGWEFVSRAQAAKGLWLPAEVPGHVHLDLQAAGVIPDPFERMHEAGVQWVDQEDWTYRCRFVWEPKDDLPRRVLRFEGLDTIATISLNGEVIGHSANMHVPLELDVTDRLQEGENELQVEFLSAARIGESLKADYLASEGLRPDCANFFDRSFVRKAQYMFGWDWGPRLVSCGIWQPVRLLEFAARVTDVHIRQEHHKKDGSVETWFSVELEGEAQTALFVTAPDGERLPVGPSGRLKFKEPYLWWTHDLGESHLYSLEIEVQPTASAPFVETRRFGLRTIRLRREKDEFGESFQFVLNGVPIYARGANWIPDHSFPSSITPSQLFDQFARVVDMNMNMLRVWGGGLYESDAFYDHADEQGVLIWQDFAYSCAYYPDGPEAQEAARQEAIANVKRLRNRASLALWCGNNESLTMFEGPWGGKERNPDRYYGEHIYNEVLPQVLAELDPERDYIPTSPWGGEKSNDGGIGDQHYWNVWHGGDWRNYADSTARFCSEFGFSGSPSMDVWNRYLGDNDRDPNGSQVRWHDKTGKTTEIYNGYTTLHYPEPQDLEELVYYTQLNQRDALRFGIEHFRRSAFCKGTLIWQLNDCWPVQSWAVVDCLGNYKAAAYDLRRLYADVLVSMDRQGAVVKVHCVNDGMENVKDDLIVRAVSLATGEVVREWEQKVSVKPGDRKVGLEVSIKGLNTAETLVVAYWESAWGWTLLCEPKDARPAKFEVHASSAGADGLILRAEGPVVDLCLGGYGWEHGLSDGGPLQGPGTQIFVTLPERGDYEMSFLKAPTRLRGRSLAGWHEIRVSRAPL